MDKKTYEIVVHFDKDDTGGYQSQFATPTPEPQSSTSPTGGSGGYAPPVQGSNFATIAKAVVGASVVKQTFSFAYNIAERTRGCSSEQQQINAAMNIAMSVGGIAGAFAAGGPITGILAIASVGITKLQEAEQTDYNKRLEHIQRELLYEQHGAALNRSRG